MSTTTFYAGPMHEMSVADLAALRERVLPRVGWNEAKADRLVAAYLKGRSEAEANRRRKELR